MYRVSLKDVGPDRVTKDVTAHVEYLVQAETYAIFNCSIILGYVDVSMIETGNGEYVVMHGGLPVGSFTITKLN